MHRLNFYLLRLWAEATTFRNRLAFSVVFALFLTTVGPNAGAQTRKEFKAGKQVLAESAQETGWAAVPQTTANPWTWAGKSLREVAAWIPEQERLSDWSVDTAAGAAVGGAGEGNSRILEVVHAYPGSKKQEVQLIAAKRPNEPWRVDLVGVSNFSTAALRTFLKDSRKTERSDVGVRMVESAEMDGAPEFVFSLNSVEGMTLTFLKPSSENSKGKSGSPKTLFSTSIYRGFASDMPSVESLIPSAGATLESIRMQDTVLYEGATNEEGLGILLRDGWGYRARWVGGFDSLAPVPMELQKVDKVYFFVEPSMAPYFERWCQLEQFNHYLTSDDEGVLYAGPVLSDGRQSLVFRMTFSMEVDNTEGTMAVFWTVDNDEYQALLNEIMEASAGEE
jgi:hypothetical protein